MAFQALVTFRICNFAKLGTGALTRYVASKQFLMQLEEIPAFVDDVIKAGCDICAIGHDGHVIGDIQSAAA
jgi:hypothetical protein